MAAPVSPSPAHLIPAELLRRVPGCEAGQAPLSVVSLVRREVNRNFCVETREGTFVVRLSPQTDAWLLGDRVNELLLHTLAARARIAPRIGYADPARGWMVMDFVSGPVWSASDFSLPERLELLGDTLRRLHALHAPLGGRLDVGVTLRAYGEILNRREPEMADRLTRRVAAAERIWGDLQRAARPLAILHHDLHASNIIDHRGQPVLIDWECAVVSDPILDVACACAYYPHAREHARRLLDQAGLERVTLDELDAAIHVFDVHTWLWYRERRERFPPTTEEIAAERDLDTRLSV